MEDLEEFKKRYVRNGLIIAIPRKARFRKAMGRYLISLFDAGVTYTEFEVNGILGEVGGDSASLRRFLVDSGLLARDVRGERYSINAGSC